MFDKFRETYYQIFPELEINIDADKRIMYPKKIIKIIFLI